MPMITIFFVTAWFCCTLKFSKLFSFAGKNFGVILKSLNLRQCVCSPAKGTQCAASYLHCVVLACVKACLRTMSGVENY